MSNDRPKPNPLAGRLDDRGKRVLAYGLVVVAAFILGMLVWAFITATAVPRVHYHHDEARAVSCWVADSGIICLPDFQLTP